MEVRAQWSRIINIFTRLKPPQKPNVDMGIKVTILCIAGKHAKREKRKIRGKINEEYISEQGDESDYQEWRPAIIARFQNKYDLATLKKKLLQ
jgi:ribosomal protein S3AE